ncbi:MAG: helix-turn-helix domain-containing protein [Zoogloea sp.]|nr:helix-turn-helix domain-containing protein [Zoogloea sp.]
MKPISRYLDDAINRGLSKNDSETARKIGVTRAAVSDWRVGRRAPDDDQAVRLAELLGVEAGEVLAECGAARAKTPETRRAWERIAARMAASSITACAMVIDTGQSQEASASQSMPYQQSAPSNFQKLK